MSKIRKVGFGYVLDGKGGAEKLDLNNIKKTLNSGKMVWLHLDLANPKVLMWFKEQSFVNKWLFENLTCPDIYEPKIRIYQNRLLITLRSVHLTPKSKPDDLVLLRIYLKENFVITASAKPTIDFTETNRRFREKRGAKDVYGVLVDVLDDTLDNITRSISNMEDIVNETEEKIILNKIKDSHYPVLSELLRQVIVARRFIAPEREMLDLLVRQGEKFLTPDTERNLRDNFDRVRRIVEDIDLMEKRIRLNQDVLSHLEDKQTQRNTYMLSVVAGVFLPLSFLASVFGMNLGGIPLSEDRFGFLLINLVMIFIGILIWVLFKRLKWV